MSDFLRETSASAPLTNARPIFWSIKRELWENRSLYLAPLAIAAITLFVYGLSTFSLAPRLREAELARSQSIVMPFSAIAAFLLISSFLIAAYYCVDALNGERRDRSLLFWKSLPISDREAVLSKAAIPFVVQPAIVFLIALLTQLNMFAVSIAVLASHGISPARLTARVPLAQMTVIMAYGLTAHVLWLAPIYGWLLMVSAWARRAALLWAVLPWLVAMALERILFSTTFLGDFVKYRLTGAMSEAFVPMGNEDAILRVSELAPLKFLSSAGLWIGLVLAAVFLAAAVRLRRNREPM
ncbi:MAG: ABC transporter permease [Acidobacteria bacterium]|nr:ABC transporter permease [Acidobacteriota bacterium]